MLTNLPAGIEPTRLRRQAAEVRLAKLEADSEALSVKAPEAGVVESARGGGSRGDLDGARLALWAKSWARGPGWEFLAVVPRAKPGSCFGRENPRREHQVHGHGAARRCAVTSWRVVPGRQGHAAHGRPRLGREGPGEGPARRSPRDYQAAEPFFLVIARGGRPGPETGRRRPARSLWQGRTGIFIRFDLPPSPLLVRWVP